MSRRARYGLAAVIVSIFTTLFGYVPTTSYAQTSALRFRVFVPGVVGGPKSAPQATSIEQQTVDVINQQRRANGCSDVTFNVELSAAALRHSQDMADRNFFDHTGSDGSSFVDRAKAAGYANQPSGEIIAAGYGTPEAVVDGWMKSDGHRRIILTCQNDDIGVGLVTKSGTRYGSYWTAVFGQR